MEFDDRLLVYISPFVGEYAKYCFSSYIHIILWRFLLQSLEFVRPYFSPFPFLIIAWAMFFIIAWAMDLDKTDSVLYD